MKKVRVENAVGMALCHDITAMRDGGLCQQCGSCQWPNCTFGRY